MKVMPNQNQIRNRWNHMKPNKSYTLTARDPKQQIWGISGGLGDLESEGLESGDLESGGLESGGLESRATDFGSGTVHTWGLESGSLESGGLESRDQSLGQPISNLAPHMPVLKKKYREPLFRFAPFV